MLEVLDLELLAAVAEVDDVAGRARGRDRRDFVERELPLGEDVQDLAPDIARRTDDRDPVTHLLVTSLAFGGGRGGLGADDCQRDAKLSLSAPEWGAAMMREWLARTAGVRAAAGRLCAEGRADRPAAAPAQVRAGRVRHRARARPPPAHSRRPAAASGRQRRRRRRSRSPDRRAARDRPPAAGSGSDGLQRVSQDARRQLLARPQRDRDDSGRSARARICCSTPITTARRPVPAPATTVSASRPCSRSARS